MKNRKQFIVVAGAVAVLVLGAWTFFGRGSSKGAESYGFATVERGDLRKVVSSTGTVTGLEQVDVGSLSRNERADLRNQKFGFVFQGFNLLPRTSAVENVGLPLMYDRMARVAHPRRRESGAVSAGLRRP